MDSPSSIDKVRSHRPVKRNSLTHPGWKHNTPRGGKRHATPCAGAFDRRGAAIVRGIGGRLHNIRKRKSPVGLGSLLQFRDAENYAYFQQVYRTGNFYLDFRPALVFDGIVKDRQ